MFAPDMALPISRKLEDTSKKRAGLDLSPPLIEDVSCLILLLNHLILTKVRTKRWT